MCGCVGDWDQVEGRLYHEYRGRNRPELLDYEGPLAKKDAAAGEGDEGCCAAFGTHRTRTFTSLLARTLPRRVPVTRSPETKRTPGLRR